MTDLLRLMTLAVILVACGDHTAEAGSGVVGHWTLTTVEGEAVARRAFQVEFTADGKFLVVGPCHRSEGQYFRTGRGATLQPVELREETDCSPAGRELTRRVRSAVLASSRVGSSREGYLEFYDRLGTVRIRLERVSQPARASEGR